MEFKEAGGERNNLFIFKLGGRDLFIFKLRKLNCEH